MIIDRISADKMLYFKIDSNTCINHHIELEIINSEFCGEFGIYNKISDPQYEIYRDSYSIIPSSFDQLLDTQGKIMADDLLVEKIPYHEVSNDTGITVTIGGWH